MRSIVRVLLLAHPALCASAGSESCDRRIASLERQLVRLSERLSLCLRDRTDIGVNDSEWTASDESKTHGLPQFKRHASARRLLQQTSAGNFTMGQARTNECAAGFSPLGSEADCAAAAAQFELTFQGSEEAADYPAGCYAYPGEGVYFNQHATGTAELDSTPICADDSYVSKQLSGGTATSPLAFIESTP